MGKSCPYLSHFLFTRSLIGPLTRLYRCLYSEGGENSPPKPGCVMYYISFSDGPLNRLSVDTEYYNTPKEAEDYLFQNVVALDSVWIAISEIERSVNKTIPSIVSFYRDGNSNRWARIVKVSEKRGSRLKKEKEERIEKKLEKLSQYEKDVHHQSKLDKQRAEEGFLPKFLILNAANICNWNACREKHHLNKYILIHSSYTKLVGLDSHDNGYAEYMVYRLMDKYLDFNQQ